MQKGPPSTGESPEVEVEVDPQASRGSLWWERWGSHVSVTPDPQIMIPFIHIHPKWNHTIARGDPVRPGQITLPIAHITHPLAVHDQDPQVEEAHHSLANPKGTGRPLRDIFLTTQMTGDQAPHKIIGGHSGDPEDSPVSSIMNSGVRIIVAVTVPEKGRLIIQVKAWSAGTRKEDTPVQTMDNTGPLGRTGVPEKWMREARVQRGIWVEKLSRLGKKKLRMKLEAGPLCGHNDNLVCALNF